MSIREVWERGQSDRARHGHGHGPLHRSRSTMCRALTFPARIDLHTWEREVKKLQSLLFWDVL